LGSASEKLNDHPSDRAQRQLDALRAALEDRLVALEAALADPTGGESLERLILDLARSVTEESRAAASKVCVDTKLEADKQIAQSLAAEQHAVTRERTLASELSRAVEQAQQRIAGLESERQAELRGVRKELEADIARLRATSAGFERAAADARTQVIGAQRELQTERLSSIELRRAAERESELSATLAREKAQALAAYQKIESELVREREGATDLQRAHAQAQEELEAELDRARASSAELGLAADRAVELSTTLAHENAQALAAHQKIESELAEIETELVREREAGAGVQRILEETNAELHAERESSAEARQVAENAEALLATLGPENAQARAVHEQLTTELTAEREAAADLQRTLVETYAELKAELTSSAEARRVAQDAEARLATLEPENAKVRAVREELTAELARERAAAANLQRALVEARSQLEAESRSSAELQRVAEQAEQRLSSVVSDNVQTLSALAEMQRELESARAGALALRTDLDAARLRLEELEVARSSAEAASREAETRLESVAAEHDALAGGLPAARQRTDVPRESKKAAPAPSVQALPRKPEHKVEKKHAVPVPAPASDQVWDSIRIATRYTFRDPIVVHINGESGLLYDLSVAGCQFVSPAAVKPNQMVKLLLPFGPKPIACSGKIMWARLEPPAAGRLFGYRAGVRFTKPDESAIEAFLAKHSATA
jgi:chromosome segregation ATPase